MNIKKMSGSLAVAIAVLGLSSVATADCLDTITEIEMKAVELRCSDTGYNTDTAIWQYKRNGDGCVIHSKLARKLNEVRTEEPPRINKKGTNTAAGAANSFANGKYEAGLASLQDFIDTMLYSAKANPGKQGEEDLLVEWATDVYTEAADVCMP